MEAIEVVVFRMFCEIKIYNFGFVCCSWREKSCWGMFGERSFWVGLLVVVLCYCVCEGITPSIGTLYRSRDRLPEVFC